MREEHTNYECSYTERKKRGRKEGKNVIMKKVKERNYKNCDIENEERMKRKRGTNEMIL
jgi:hypothetical protein